ncbi:hypothetical protein BSL82_09495 [Tardibacter chloracetimidivorans]|uniref:Uncharacterized protein n=1 Tax=Tardibacter chloracetimidivorans TaxID=1921510 RepID=A0A1L3ZV35_9SPHN|nr:hypothetical protein [Tardibacter chloracetimidivorans]API59514.1 hypothetical protein BSL82_09495 [Tardibacter chloracetimidivorans]
MSLKVCIPQMLERGEVTPEQAAQMEELYDSLEREYARQMGAAAAAAKASEETLTRLEAEALTRKRQALLQISAQQQALENIKSFDGPVGTAALAMIDQDSRAQYSNVEGRRKAVVGRAHAMMEGVLAKHRRTLIGRVRDPAGLTDIVRELFGADTGNLAAKELADAWRQTAEMLRTRFNAAGGAIGKLEGWGMPQSHDSFKVRRAGFQSWYDFILPRLDPERMIDDITGRPFTAEGLREALTHVYETIRTEGWADRAPGTVGGKKLANKRADERFLVFKDADSWLSYQESFGSATPFDSMMGHISGMSRDIAMMEILGPSPKATVRWLQDVIQKDAALGAGDNIDAASSSVRQLQAMFDTVSGAAQTPVSQKMARRFSGIRSVLTSAMLGSAAISATTDTAFQAVTRRFNGLPVAGAITGYLKLLRPTMTADQKVAIRLGLIAEEASKMAASQNRYIGESVGPELASRLADGILRASGLSAWTQAGRWAFGMEFLGHIADQSGKNMDALDPAFRRALQRYGISPEDWDVIRTTEQYKHGGASFLRPEDVADQRLGDRLLEMVLTETDFAVPSATVRARSVMNVERPGTWMGEIARSALLFKSFGVSMLLTHGRRTMEQQGFSRLQYAAGLAITTTLMGALALQLKEIAKGRDPRPMNDQKFWGAALLQGGGFGIFGDFITSTENRFGGGLSGTMAGPVVGAVGDAITLTAGNAWETYQGKDMRLGRDMVKFAKRYTPGGSLWYARLAFERTMLDQMQAMVDPEYYEAFSRVEKYARETGQEYWWRPGEVGPDRAPDMETALEEMPD